MVMSGGRGTDVRKWEGGVSFINSAAVVATPRPVVNHVAPELCAATRADSRNCLLSRIYGLHSPSPPPPARPAFISEALGPGRSNILAFQRLLEMFLNGSWLGRRVLGKSTNCHRTFTIL